MPLDHFGAETSAIFSLAVFLFVSQQQRSVNTKVQQAVLSLNAFLGGHVGPTVIEERYHIGELHCPSPWVVPGQSKNFEHPRKKSQYLRCTVFGS